MSGGNTVTVGLRVVSLAGVALVLAVLALVTVVVASLVVSAMVLVASPLDQGAGETSVSGSEDSASPQDGVSNAGAFRTGRVSPSGGAVGSMPVDGSSADPWPVDGSSAEPWPVDGSSADGADSPPLDEVLMGPWERLALEETADTEPPAVPVVVLGSSRTAGVEDLDHDTRRAIFEVVRDRPGSYLAEIAQRTDTHISTVRYHCRVLVADGLLERRQVDGFHRLFPADGSVADGGHTLDVPLRSLLAGDSRRQVALTLDRTGPTSVTELADDLELAESTVSYHLDRLESDGILERTRDGRAVEVRIAPEWTTPLTSLVEADVTERQ